MYLHKHYIFTSPKKNGFNYVITMEFEKYIIGRWFYSFFIFFSALSLSLCVCESVLVYFNFFCLQIVILAMSMAAFVYRTYNQVHILSVYLSIYLRIYLCTHAHSIWEYACRDGGRLFIYYFYSLWLFSLIVVCVSVWLMNAFVRILF